MKNRTSHQIKALIIVCFFLINTVFIAVCSEKTSAESIILNLDSTTESVNKPNQDGLDSSGDVSLSYQDYKEIYQKANRPQEDINVDVSSYNISDSTYQWVEKLDGPHSEGLLTSSDGYAEWNFSITNAGMYNIEVAYLPVEDKGSTIVRELWIDGRKPFSETGSISFSRAFQNADAIITDSNGNQQRPSQVEKFEWQLSVFRDSLGYFNEPLQFFLSSGSHSMRLVSIKESMIIGSILIRRISPIISQSDKEQQFESSGYQPTTGISIDIQGEDAVLKSDSSIYPINDSSSAITKPSSSTKILLNTIGGLKWQKIGQWTEWGFSAPKTGLYKIGIKARQGVYSGQPSYRRIYIDGEVYSDAYEQVKFPYSTKWGMYVIGGEEHPSLVYLKEGVHIIRLEAQLGEMTELIQQITASMIELNRIYRSFLAIVGPTADKNRDYDFKILFPDEIEEIERQSIILNDISEKYIDVNGEESAQSQQLKMFAAQLKKMHDKPDRIAKVFSDFLNNISALGSWVNSVTNQPLEIDYISVYSPELPFLAANAGLWTDFIFSAKRFAASFFIDYESITTANGNDDAITVWTFSGRDQANALNQLILNDYTPNSKIPVNLQLVPPGTLLNATLAGKGPDIALSSGSSDPINYAIRGAVENLKQFSDYEQIAQRFSASARTPFEFGESAYALPETQSFPVLIYRSDIIEEYDLEIPETWEDVIAMLPELQKRNLTFGLPQPYLPNATGVGLGAFAMFLYQNGGDFYSTDGSLSLLDSNEAISAFSKWVNFYNLYSLPTQYDFNSRFRTGEMPIGIGDYSLYNSLSVFAPELSGVTRFALVPGTIRSSGEIDHTVWSSVTATIMMSNPSDKMNCWDFMKWWSSMDAQTKYGSEIESIMGTVGRYQPANKDALTRIPWATNDLKILMEQMNWTKGIPEVPGSYMTPRYIDFAFKQAYTGTSSSSSLLFNDAGEILINATRLINIELYNKRREFGIEPKE
jgi:ABC-type glycerol-3-phosphate transport system substrate-binding protein